MPDGLSKTVPIWCCVVNRALKLRWQKTGVPVPEDWDTDAYLPGQIVSPSERAQIEDRIDGWAEDLEVSNEHVITS
jgi:tRNA A64-2'-O-ribosylphosphate transferase